MCITFGQRGRKVKKCLKKFLGHAERKLKPHLALNLATSVKDNKDDFLNTLMAKVETKRTSIPQKGGYGYQKCGKC